VLVAGLNLYAYLYRAVPGRQPDEQFGLFKATFLFEVCTAAALVVLLLATGAIGPAVALMHADGYQAAFAVGLIVLVLLVALAEATYFLTAQAHIEKANWVDFVSQAAWTVPFAAWWAAGLPVTVTTVLLAQLGGCIVALILAARLIGVSRVLRAAPRWTELRPAIAFSVPMILPAVSFYLLKLADRFILSSYWSLSEVGVYTFAYTFVNVLYTFTAWAIFNAFGPRIVAAHNTGDFARRDLLQTYMMKASLVGFVAGLVALLALYRPLIAAVARPEYAAAAGVLPLVAVSFVFIIIGYPAGNMLFVQNRVRASAGIDLLGVGVGIAANLLLIPRWSYTGAAAASALGFAVTAAGKYAISGTLGALRGDILFSLAGEVRVVGAWYLRWRGAPE
jgi:O-antigen/teichoic acid export membrane protein